jgi:hypothetical protein
MTSTRRTKRGNESRFGCISRLKSEPAKSERAHLIAEMARRYKKSYNQSDTAKMIDTAQPNLALAAVVLDYAQDLERRSTFGSDSACWIPI